MGRKEVLSLAAIEGKMGLIPDIARKLEANDIRRVVIVEDRLKNLVSAKKAMQDAVPSLDVFPVWVRVGMYRNKFESGRENAEWLEWAHAIDTIGGLSTTLESNHVFEDDIPVAVLFDLDGPLHDDDLRKTLQVDAVLAALLRHGWIGKAGEN